MTPIFWCARHVVHLVGESPSYTGVKGNRRSTFVTSASQSVRLFGVNAPEHGEKCYREATARLRKLAGGEVRVELGPRSQDRYGRRLYYVYTRDGDSIDEILVSEGLAKAWTGEISRQVAGAAEFGDTVPEPKAPTGSGPATPAPARPRTQRGPAPTAMPPERIERYQQIYQDLSSGRKAEFKRQVRLGMRKDPDVARVVRSLLGKGNEPPTDASPRWLGIYISLFEAFRRSDLPPELAPFYPRVRMPAGSR